MLQCRENSIKVLFFAYKNMTKTPAKVEYKIEDIFPYCPNGNCLPNWG